MKLTFALLFVVSMGVFATGNAQTMRVNISADNVSTGKILSEIERQTDYLFVYDKNEVDLKRKTSVNAVNKTTAEVLSAIFDGTDIVYAIEGENIMLMRREKELAAAPAAAQQDHKITGTVLDPAGVPVIGANIVIKGTTTGTITDMDGKFALEVPSGATLVVTYVGYATQEIPVGNQKTLSITLKEDTEALDEVVVVGYGTMRKRDVSGSVASVSGETLQEISAVTATSALQGRVSGVQINQNSGLPGSTMQIRIRGANSIMGGNEPIWIINGFPGDIGMINNADIESIEILKDASATAIYGSRGSNGVVLVTTKGAKEGDLKVEYRGSFGMQNPVKTMDTMDSWEYMDYLNEKAEINKRPAVFTPEQMAAVTISTDWQKEIFRSGIITEHSLHINSGNSKFQEAFGISYFDQAGIIKNSGYRRISFNTDLKYNFSKFVSAHANIIFSRSNRDIINSFDVIRAALQAPPIATPRKADGKWNDFYDTPSGGTLNAVAIIEEKQNKWHSNRLMANAGITVKPIDGLSIETSVSIVNKDNREDLYIPTTYKEDFPGSASITFGNDLMFTNNNIITYDRKMGRHRVNVMGGITYETSVSKSTSTGTAEGFLSDAGGTFDLDAATVKGLPGSSYSDWKILSFLGRINYNYDDRYLLTVNFRSDGSSRFNKGNRWGYFPSVAVAWRLKQENFLKDADWLSELKLRTSYGITGNTGISPYATMNTLSTNNVVLGDELVSAYMISYTYTGELKWERTAQTDVGLDLAFFDSRLRLTTDYYYKKTTDLLCNVEMPRSSGYTTALRNIGSVSNRGFELQIDGRILDGAVKWDLGANVSLNRNRVEKLPNHKDVFGSTVSNSFVRGQLNLLREGSPMCAFYGYVEQGYDDEGKIVYKDLDDDGKITTSDREIIGDPNPNFLLGINTALKYKRFSMNAFFSGTFGNDIYGLSMASYAYGYNLDNPLLRDVIGNYWTPDKPNAKYPNIRQDVNLMMSDRFVYNGSYLRLKNLEFAYDVPCGKGKFISKARISVSAQNLFTITSYPFWDPDVNGNGGGSSLLQGIDTGLYPSARTFMVGVKLNF